MNFRLILGFYYFFRFATPGYDECLGSDVLRVIDNCQQFSGLCFNRQTFDQC